MTVTGAIVLVFATLQAQTAFPAQTQVMSAQVANKIVEVSIIAFIGLGLVLIGILTMFATPKPLIASEIAGRLLIPSRDNLALIVESLRTKSRGYHIPSVVLGRESEVFLMISQEGELPLPNLGDSSRRPEISWSPIQRVLKPTGVALMNGYEETLKRDFLGLDVPQLARLLAKAIVPEYQLCSAFSIVGTPSGRLVATWTKPAVAHTCVTEKGSNHPELCCLCSSVACALAKATGRAVWIEETSLDGTSSVVTTTYQIVGD